MSRAHGVQGCSIDSDFARCDSDGGGHWLLSMEAAPDDAELLRRYVTEGADAAFAELVRRHLPLVYHAARRQVNGGDHAAEDVTQAVFTLLARKAVRLRSHDSLAGWLHTTTRFIASEMRRAEARRRAREQEATLMHEPATHGTSETEWERLRPVVDEAVAQLGERDREAVLLRFFANLPFAEVGARLNMSENTARMRVERALEKLRAILGRRGVISTEAVLTTMFATQASAMVPVGLAATVTTSALASGASAGMGLLVAGISFMNVTKVAMVVALAGLIAATTFSWRERGQSEIELTVANAVHASARARVEAARIRLAAAQQEAAALERMVATARVAEQQPAAATPAPAPPPPWNPVAEGRAFMVRHPEVKRALDDYATASLRFKFGALYREFSWSEDKIAEFTQLVARGIGMGADSADGRSVTLRYGDDGSPPDFAATFDRLLGSDAMRRWDALQSRLAGRYLAREMASALYFADTPLTPQQAESLIEIVAQTNPPKQVTGMVPLAWSEIAAKAEGLLSPPQLEVLAGLRAKGEFHRMLNRPRASGTEKGKSGGTP